MVHSLHLMKTIIMHQEVIQVDKISLTQSDVSISNGSNTGTVNIDVGVNNVNCKVIVTVQRGSVSESSKTLIKGAVLNVNTANSTSNYGTSYQHNDITLGVSDVFAVRGIFEGGNAVSSGGAGCIDRPSTTIIHLYSRFWK